MENLLETTALVEGLLRKIGRSILLPHFAKVKNECKSDGSWLTTADTQAHEALVQELPNLYMCSVLSEEMSAESQRHTVEQSSNTYWCIDPLDGTSNFVSGIPYWCTSVALVVNGKVQIAVVYDPNRDESFSAYGDSKTMLNGLIMSEPFSEVNALEDSIALIDFKRLSESVRTNLCAKPPYRSQRSFGASALDFCWVAANRCQIYLHGKQNLWDYVAGQKILGQAGGVCETFDAEMLFENTLKQKSIIAASNKNLFLQWRKYFDQLRNQADQYKLSKVYP